MSYILHFDTATKTCSVALSQGGTLVAYKDAGGSSYSHSGLLTVLTEELLKSQNVSFDELSAVCVNKGPGSYTGLRIGTSAAKGICYAKDIPLLAVNSLLNLANLCYEQKSEHKELIEKHSDFYLCPMIDARRMEVYSAVYDNELRPVKDIEATVIDENSFKELINEKAFFIFGDGAEKCVDILKHPNLYYIKIIISSARGLVSPAYQKFINKDFEDVAYFEPFYLKEFAAGKPKVKGLR